MTEPVTEDLKICDRHADRLNWAMTLLQNRMPFTGHTLTLLNDIEIARLDQFLTRFDKLLEIPFHTIIRMIKDYKRPY
jgi:hypothetical protein